LLEKSKTLLCHASRFDYAQADDLNNKTLAAVRSDIFLLTDKMKKDKIDYDPEGNVNPYHIKSAQRTLEMRRLRGLYQSQRAAIQAGTDIKATLRDYEVVCGAK
jgi:hypothetical protein